MKTILIVMSAMFILKGTYMISKLYQDGVMDRYVEDVRAILIEQSNELEGINLITGITKDEAIELLTESISEDQKSKYLFKCGIYITIGIGLGLGVLLYM